MQPGAESAQDTASGSPNDVQTSNGPVPNSDKSWMRAWDLNEIRQQANDWNLAADAGLLKYLQAFSLSFMQKAQESTLGVNNLMHDTSMADARVRNVTDRFMTLSDSQFIENRVYDEDVSLETNGDVKVGEQDAKEENENVDPFPKLKSAIQMGLKVLEDSYDVLDTDAANSDYDSELDSDDDTSGANGKPEQKLYEPIDPYVARPLPYLIGSRAFQESDDVGIRDLPSDDEVVLDDQGSISESDEDIEKPSYQSDSADSSDYSYSDTDESDSVQSDQDQPEQIARKLSSTASEQEDLFHKSDDYSSEDASITAVKAKQKPPQKKKVKKPKKSAQPNLFDSDEGKDSDGDDLFGDSGGLFGNAPNLFDKKKTTGGLFDGADVSEEETDEDSNDKDADESQKLSSDEDMEDPEKDEEVSKAKTPKPHGGISLFSGALNKELLSKTRKDSTTSRSDSMSQASERSSIKKAANLFADDESEDDELFSSKPPKVMPSAKLNKSVPLKSEDKKPTAFQSREPRTKTKPSNDLFGSDSTDDDGALFGDAPAQGLVKASPKHKAPSKNTLSQEKKKAVIFDSASSDEDSMFSKKPPPVISSVKPGKTSTTKSGGLFDSDSDDDFFADQVKSTPKSKTKPKVLVDSESDDDLFNATPVAKEKPNISDVKKPSKTSASNSYLFGDSDTDDDFPSVVSKITENSSAKESDVKPVSGVRQSDDLFGDDSEEESDDQKREATPPPTKKKPAGAVAMFGGGFGGGELSAAILKRRGVSDVSTKSTSSASSKEGKEEPVTTETKVNGKLSVTPHEENDTKIPISATSKPTSVESKTLFNSTAKPFKPFASSAPSGKTPGDSKSSALQSSVSSIRANLAINPSSLLPGAAPKRKPAVQTEISFDKPPDHKTLDSMNKTRARGQKNRRPPSRHIRGKLSVKNDDSGAPSFVEEPYGIGDDSAESPADKIEQSGSVPTVDAKIEEGLHSTDAPNPSKVPEDSKADLFENPASKYSEQSKSLLDTSDLDDELFSGSLFTKSEKSKTSKAPKLFDDIFNEGNDFLADPISNNKTSLHNSVKSAIAEDDDIFGDVSIDSILPQSRKKGSSASKDHGSTASTESKKISSLFSNDEEDLDIFGDPGRSTKGKTSSKSVSASVDDMDIFGDGGSATPASTKPESKGAADDSDIFGVEPTLAKNPDVITGMNDDIFGENILDDSRRSTSSSTKPKLKESTKAVESVLVEKPNQKKPKPATDANDDIFGDDIFGDTSSTSKKTKKTGKKQKSSKLNAGASIFDDDDDDVNDIFAVSSNKKKKSSSKSSTVKKSEKAVQSKSAPSAVMDDPLSMP